MQLSYQTVVAIMEAKNTYGNIYTQWKGNTPVICRQPTLSELNTCFGVAEKLKLNPTDVCICLAKFLQVYGPEDEETLYDIGETILSSLPKDTNEWLSKKEPAYFQPYQAFMDIRLKLGLSISEVQKLTISEAMDRLAELRAASEKVSENKEEQKQEDLSFFGVPKNVKMPNVKINFK